MKVKRLFLFLLISTGSITWSLTMVRSGLLGEYGYGFWGPNGHDGIWHIAVANGFARGTWEIPIFPPDIIKNYHIGYDLILAILHKITFIPISVIYFQILPVLIAFGTGLLCYLFVFRWRKSPTQAFWATFFVYFGGSFGWIVNWIKWKHFDGESMFWSQQSISTLVNPPFAMSVLVIFIGLNMLLKVEEEQSVGDQEIKHFFSWFEKILMFVRKAVPTKFEKQRRKRKKMLQIVTIVLLGLLIQIKAYAGILVLGSLFVAGLYQLINLKGFSILKIFFGSLVVSVVVFLPLTDLSKTSFIFKPFWFLETMMGLSDRVNWQKYFQAMTTYRYLNYYLKALIFYFGAFVIFIVGNLGTRIISVLYFLKLQKRNNNISYIDVLLFTIIGLGIFIPTFFVQSATAWNTIQFFYYSLIFLGIYAGIVVGSNTNNSRIAKILITAFKIIMIILTIPTSLATLKNHYLPKRPPAILSEDEHDALKYLSKQDNGIVLTYPYDKQKSEDAVNNPPRPLYLYEATAYVSAYSNKPVYLEDEVNLDITGYEWRDRKNEVIKFYESLDHEFVYDFLRENNILYVYWVDGQRATLGESQLGLEEIYKNNSVKIFKVL